MQPTLGTLAPIAVLTLTSCLFGQGAAELFEENTTPFLWKHRRLEYPADLDGDGRMELVGVWRHSVSFHYQDENGAWTDEARTLESQIPLINLVTTAVGDFDADGKDELVVFHWEGLAVVEPGLSYGEPRILFQQDHDRSLQGILSGDCSVADFDGDGREDIVAIVGRELLFLRSTPGAFEVSGQFTFLNQPDNNDDLNLRVTAADLDQRPTSTGPEVLVFCNRPRPTLRIFTNVARRGLGAQRIVALDPRLGQAGVAQVAAAPGDVDGDGDLDVALFGMDGRYQILRNTEAGMSLEPLRVGGPATDLADVDGDGALDGICCGGGTGSPSHYNTRPSRFHICLNDGTGAFDNAVAFDGVGAHHVAGVLDFDMDGDLDVLAGRSVLLNSTVLGAELCASNPNSTGAAGRLTIGGSVSIAAGGPWIVAKDLPTRTIGILYANRADSHYYPIEPRPFWDGTMCLPAQQLYRMNVAYADASGAADFSRPVDWRTNYWGNGYSPNRIHGYHVWYRDERMGLSGANVTNSERIYLGR